MTDRIKNLVASLGLEIAMTEPGSHQSQFPVLDLLGNIRDQAGESPDFTALHLECSQAWEKVVVIVESGRPFSAEDVAWLRECHGRIKELLQPSASVPATADAQARPAAERPAASPAGNDYFTPNLTEDADLLREFVNESKEHLDNIEQGVLVLEHQPDDAEMLHTIFRAFHTFKGSAGALNLMPINRLAHALESLLDLARQGDLVIDRQIIELILGGRDLLKQAIEDVEGQVLGLKPLSPIELPAAALKAAVMEIVEAVSAGTWNAAVDKAETVPGPSAESPDTSEARDPSEMTPEEPDKAATVETPVSQAVAAQPAAPEEQRPSRAVERGGVVKVDTTKLDALLDLVGEMVIAQSLVAQDLTGLANLKPQFTRNLAQLSRTTRELQRVSMSLRMVPIRGAFQKMARVVRDVAAKQQKRVQLVTSGEDTELDRGVVEELNDPLLHMIRNSIDHGIESAEVRAAQGKPALATIHLRAYHQGGNIVLEIEDDGKGLDRERILAKALERGLAAPGAKLSDEEIFSFIFSAGFSTADKVTEISGRGVGLDVVRRNLERLRGRADTESTPGQGTCFKITLPLTLAIIDGLIVKVGDERYIIPTLSVRESFRPHAEMISRVQGVGEVVNVRGRLMPLLRLYERFGLTPAATDPMQGIVVVVQSGASCRCLLVDTLLAKQEVVIKNLNELMIHKNRSLAGAAILGDGRVGLILDVNALVQQEGRAFAEAA